MNFYKDWKDYVQHKRVEKGFTQSELAEKLGVSADLYWKIELGMVQPSKTLFSKLIKILDLDELFCVVLIKKQIKAHGGRLLEEK